jgi:hypothetical protein
MACNSKAVIFWVLPLIVLCFLSLKHSPIGGVTHLARNTDFSWRYRCLSCGCPFYSPLYLSVLLSVSVPIRTMAKLTEHCRVCVQKIMKSLAARQLFSPENFAQQEGTLVLKHSEKFEKHLQSLPVKYDTCKHGVSLSPHIYTSTQEFDDICDCFQRELFY